MRDPGLSPEKLMTKKGKNLFLHSAVFLALVSVDFYSKSFMVRALIDVEALDLLPFLKFVLVHNRGAAFGFLGDANGWQLAVFVGVAIIISLLIVIRLFASAGSEPWYEMSLVLILSGAIGNMIDRIRAGYVIDFIQVYYQDWYFPAFNLADISIFSGVLILIFHVLVKDRENHKGV